jgi:WD40 repeat protein
LLVAFDRGGTRIASASSDMSVRIWDARPEPPGVAFRGHSGPVRRARWDPSGSRIVTAGEDGRVILWNSSGGAQISQLPRFAVSAYGAEFDPQGRRIVIALRDRTARVWNLASGEVMTLHGHEGPVAHASFDASGSRIATVTFGGDNRLRIFDARTGASTGVEVQEQPLKRALWSAVFHRDGRRVLVAAQAEQAFIWNGGVPGERVELKRDPARGTPGHRRALNWAAFDPAGRLVVTASDDGTARLWDAETGSHLRVLEPHEDFVLAAAFSPDGASVATGTRRGVIRFWRVADGRLLAIRHVPGAVPVYSLEFSPDGARLLAGLDDGVARALGTDVESQKLLERAAGVMRRWQSPR